jgi:hypothetical protein
MHIELSKLLDRAKSGPKQGVGRDQDGMATAAQDMGHGRLQISMTEYRTSLARRWDREEVVRITAPRRLSDARPGRSLLDRALDDAIVQVMRSLDLLLLEVAFARCRAASQGGEHGPERLPM